MKSISWLRLSIAIALLAVVSIGGFNNEASAATPPDSCFAFNAGTGTITDYYDHEANNSANPVCPRDVDIPSQIGGVPVTAIGAAANYWNALTSTSFANKSLTSVTVPNSVTSIGNYAFYRNQLTSVIIPNNVTNIGSGAFYGNQLTDVAISMGVTSIGNSVFSNNQFTSVTIPSSVTSISDSAFRSNQLISVTIPSSVTSIGDYAFSNNQLTSVIIPNNVTNIGDHAFRNNQLTSVTIENVSATMQHSIFSQNPVTLMTIGTNTYIEQSPTTDLACFTITGSSVNGYYRASPLVARDNGILCGQDVSVSPSVTNIGDHAFSNKQLTSVTIPNSVTSIGNNAFSYSYTLEEIDLGDSVNAIGQTAFYFSGLTSLSIPESVTSIGGWAFYGNHLTSVTIPDSVTSIGSEAFSLNHIESAVIGNGITSLNPWTFSMQADLTEWEGDWHAYENYYYGDNPIEVRKALDAIFYTRAYTADSSNPNDLNNGVIVVDWVELDGDGNSDDIANIGGHIINPANLTLDYQNKNNQSLHTIQNFTGFMDATYLRNYFVTQGPEVPGADDRSNPTPTEQAAMDDALSAYYRIGDEVTITPPTIPGYITPPTQTFVLGAADNEFSYVYTTPEDDEGSTGAGTDGSESGTGGELANTGMSIHTIIVLAGTLIATAILTFTKMNKRKGMTL